MESGNDATKDSASECLLDSDFGEDARSSWQKVVGWSNNIQRSASLFLIKNIFSIFVGYLSRQLQRYLSDHAVARCL